jgi:hypothetical protein
MSHNRSLKVLGAALALGLFLASSPALSGEDLNYASRGTRPVKGMKLKVSPNARYLVNQDDKPFLYLGDTAWTLFKRLKREEADEYLQNRQAKGFTVIQAYLLRGLEWPNAYGDLTLLDRDPTKFNEAFFKNVDYVVNRANELGLVMGIVVTYGEHVRATRTTEQVFNPTNAFAFGKLLAARYKDNAVIWLLGGDRPAAQDEAVWTAMAKGLKEGCQGTQLVSYHGSGPRPGVTDYSSSFWFHDADWLDFNMIQSGHRWGTLNYEFITHDYNLNPVKPTIDMEARYENHPDVGTTGQRMDAHQEREAAYWNMLAGAAGHGYGNNNIWQFWDPDNPPPNANHPFPFIPLRGTTHWRKAMDMEGACDMGLVRKFFELRPWYRMVPDQSVIAMGQGSGEDHIQAARAEDGSFIAAYLPFGNRVGVNMDKLAAPRLKAQWYDPREGTWTAIGEYSNRGIREFVPPSNGEQNDWVLVVEDWTKNFPTELPR